MNPPDADLMLSASEIKDRLAQLTPDELDAFEAVYHHRWKRNFLRENGWLNIVLGGLTIWLGSRVLTDFSVVSLIQFCAGILIVIHSVWCLFSTSIRLILQFAIMLLLAGLWNLMVTFVYIDIIAGLLTLMQLPSAIRIYHLYQRYKVMNLPTPDASVIKLYDYTLQEIRRGALGKDAAIIKMWIGTVRFKVLLLEDKAIFAPAQNGILFIHTKNDTNFIAGTLKPLKKWRVYGHINLTGKDERSVMNRHFFKVYAAWKGLEVALAQAQPSSWERLPRPLRLAIRVVAGFVVAVILFYVVLLTVVLIQYS